MIFCAAKIFSTKKDSDRAGREKGRQPKLAPSLNILYGLGPHTYLDRSETRHVVERDYVETTFGLDLRPHEADERQMLVRVGKERVDLAGRHIEVFSVGASYRFQRVVALAFDIVGEQCAAQRFGESVSLAENEERTRSAFVKVTLGEVMCAHHDDLALVGGNMKLTAQLC